MEKSKGKILVVDDEEDILELMTDFFTEIGYEVVSAIDGEQAMTHIQADKFHVVLLDIMMAGDDGIEVLKKIKEHDPDQCVVMMTAVKDEKLARLSIELGASEYLVKPVDMKQLELIVITLTM